MKTRALTDSHARTSPPERRVPADVCRISSSAMLGEAADRMQKFDIEDLPVVENNEIIGRITEHDIARAVAAGMDPATTPVKHAMKQGERYESSGD